MYGRTISKCYGGVPTVPAASPCGIGQQVTAGWLPAGTMGTPPQFVFSSIQSMTFEDRSTCSLFLVWTFRTYPILKSS
jgi:hypothetical protein